MSNLGSLVHVESFFVHCPNPVGDAVMSTAALRALRQRFPKAHMTLCVRPPLAVLFQGADWCDRLLVYDKKRHRTIKGFWAFLHELRSRRYDVAIVMPNSLDSALIGRFSRAPIRLGYERSGGCYLLTHTLPRPRENGKLLPVYMGAYYGALTALLGAAPASLELELPLAEETRQSARGVWDKVSPTGDQAKILVTPGAGFGSSKLWPEAYFAKAIDLLGRDYQAKILIAPGPGEDEIAKNIQQQTSYPVTVLPAIQGGLSILKGLLHEADLLISNDTGPRHVAHAFHIPAIILMGSTDPRHTATPLEKGVVLRHPIECAPCHLKQCPFQHHGCMTGIMPERVVEAARQFLKK
jgi:heptosyltransferase-2